MQIEKTARFAGLLYLGMSAIMIFGFMYIPSAFIVSGDPAATAQRITQGELVYRLGLFAQLVGQLLFIAVVLALYQLFRDVDRWQARFMVGLVCVGVAVEIGNIAHRYAPLLFLGGSDYLSAAFTQAQLEALSLTSFRLGAAIGRAVTVFWGMWLFPFGYLVIRSGWFPKILGYLLYAAGAAYVANAFVAVVIPAQHAAISRFLFPLYFAELPIIFWLAFRGAKVPEAHSMRPSTAD